MTMAQSRAQQSNSLFGDDLVLSEIKLTKEIGSGKYGKVLTAEYCGSACAAKEFSLNLGLESGSQGIQKTKDNLLKKCQRISHLRHPNIVQLFGIHYKVGSSTVPLLVMERMDNNLSDLLKDFTDIPIGTKLSILLGVSLGLKYLHSQKPSMVHCNLSSNNILLTSDLQAKLSDVGVAQIVPEKSLKKIMKTSCFVAPEILAADLDKSTTSILKICNTSTDVYSYGMIMVHTITQQFPEPKKLAIANAINQYQSHIDKIISEDSELGSLVSNCLNGAALKRPSIDKVSEKIKRLTEKWPVARKSLIILQTEFQQVTKQVQND